MSDLKTCHCGEIYSDYEEGEHLDGSTRIGRDLARKFLARFLWNVKR